MRGMCEFSHIPLYFFLKIGYDNIDKKYVSLNPNSEKTQFLKKCTEQSQYDLIIHYLIEITPLFKKKKLSDEEKVKLEPYKKIIEIYSEANKEAK